MEDVQVLAGGACAVSSKREELMGDSLTREVCVILGAQGAGWGRTEGIFGLMPGIEWERVDNCEHMETGGKISE